MNELRDLIEVTGNIVEEAWNNGRREAMKEVNGGKYEMLEEANRNLGAQIDNYERNRYEASKEIDRLTAKVKTLDEENDRLFNENSDLRGKLEDAETKIKELNEAIETNQKTEPKPKPCPFCGKEPRIYGDKPQVYIACVNQDCPVNSETIFFQTREEAIEAWNRRAEQ